MNSTVDEYIEAQVEDAKIRKSLNKRPLEEDD